MPLKVAQIARLPRLSVALLAIGLAALPTISCDLVFPNCDGAQNLRYEHLKVLKCAGWLDYVEAHVGEIEYLDVRALPGSEQHATGRAYCRSCRVEIAALERGGTLDMGSRPRGALEIAGILVHEAGHLADECRNGEDPANRAESSFILDYLRKRATC